MWLRRRGAGTHSRTSGTGDLDGVSGRNRYEEERFNPNYKGNTESQKHWVSYHQLLIDLRKRQYHHFLYCEFLLHILVFTLVVIYIGVQLDLDQITDANRVQTQLFVDAKFPRVSSPTFISFREVATQQDIAQYVFNVIYRSILDPKLLSSSNYTTIQGALTLLWGVRFRTVQVESGKGCVWRGPAEYAPSQPCVARFTPSRENSKSHGCYNFSSAEATGERRFDTPFTSYPASGWVVDLDFSDNPSDTAFLNTLQRMFSTETEESNATTAFINDETALLLISFTMFSPSTNVIMYSRLGFEFLPSGLVLPVAELKEAPFLQNSERNLAVFVVGGIMVAVIPLRLFSQVINVIKLSRLPGFSGRKYVLAWVIELLMAALMVILLIDVFIRLFTHGYRSELVNAIHTETFYAGTGNYVASWELLRIFSAFAVLLLSVYTVKYFRLFWGFRFIYSVLRASAKDLLAFCLVFLLLVVSFSSFLLLLFGPYSKTYATYLDAFCACLLQVTGYFTLRNLEYASPVELLGVSSFFVVFFIISFNLLLLNTYIAIFLKSFGIAYSEALEQEQGNLQRRKNTKTIKENNVESELPACRIEEMSRPYRLNATGGARCFAVRRGWLWRNRQLCRQCLNGNSSVWLSLQSIFCCSNHLRLSWLTTGQVIRRLQVWRKKSVNQSKNFLSFQELRSALEGEAKHRTQIDNFQVDYLFSICTLKPTATRAARFQQTISDLLQRNESTLGYIRKVKEQVEEGRLSETQRNDLIEDFHVMYEAFMDLKLQHLRAEMRLEHSVRKVLAEQETIHNSLLEIQATFQTLAAQSEDVAVI